MFETLTGMFSGPAVVKSAAKAAGIEAARLDVAPDGVVWLTVRVHGRISQHRLPTGKAFGIEDLLTLLFPPTAGPPTESPPGP